MAILEPLLAEAPDLSLGETTAMALAEMGLYSQAAAVQRDILEAARRAGLADAEERMTGNLALYEAGPPVADAVHRRGAALTGRTARCYDRANSLRRGRKCLLKAYGRYGPTHAGFRPRDRRLVRPRKS